MTSTAPDTAMPEERPADDLQTADTQAADAPALDTPSTEIPHSEAPSSEAPSAPTAPGPRFEDLNLPDPLRRAVADLGFTTPSAIQQQAIPPLLEGRDVIGVAQTGTGKTAAFGLPLLATIDPAERSVQALVLAPTRELAMQVAEAIDSFTAHLEGVETVAVYGGSPYGPQERALSRGAQVVVGTPGRVMDHMRRGNLRLDGVRYAVLDEADEMLRMGFAEDVEEILSHSPAGRQVALFSATMPPAIRKVAEDHMTSPVEVSVTPQSSTVANIDQSYAVVPFKHRTGALARVLAVCDAEAAIVFVRTRMAAEEVGAALVARGVVAATISGDVPQKERERIVARLRDGSLKVLVATDVAARGLDVDKIGLVVNFDVPREAEAYVHRIGRTGRAGRSGEAITFIGPHERRALRSIERATKQTLREAIIPSPKDVSAHRMRSRLEAVAQRQERGRLGLYRELVTEHIKAHGIDPLELAAVLGAMLVGDEGPDPQGEQEEEFMSATLRGSDREGGRREREERGVPRPEKGYTQYRIGVGHSHRAKPPAIVGAITGEGGVDGRDIGKIQIFGAFSLVQIKGSLSEEQLAGIGRARVGGRALRISEDRGPRRGKAPTGHRHDDAEPHRSRREDREERGESRDKWGHREKKRQFEGREKHGGWEKREKRDRWNKRDERENRGGRDRAEGHRFEGRGGFGSRHGEGRGRVEKREGSERFGSRPRGDRFDAKRKAARRRNTHRFGN